MAFTPENSAIRMTPELEARIATASAEEIKSILAEATVAQGLATRDIYDPQVLLPTALANTAPRGFARPITIDGVKHIVEGTTELELEQNTTALYRSIFAGNADEEDSTPARDAATGRFVAESTQDDDASALEAVRLAELELKFKRGEISTAKYIEESGALDMALRARGINPDLLQEASEVRAQETTDSEWNEAVQQFVARHPEWPGGDSNRDLVGQLLMENNLTDTDDKLGALEAVYDHAVQKGLLVVNPETELNQRILDARNPYELRDALQSPERREALERGMDLDRQSGLFGR